MVSTQCSLAASSSHAPRQYLVSGRASVESISPLLSPKLSPILSKARSVKAFQGQIHRTRCLCCQARKASHPLDQSLPLCKSKSEPTGVESAGALKRSLEESPS